MPCYVDARSMSHPSFKGLRIGIPIIIPSKEGGYLQGVYNNKSEDASAESRVPNVVPRPPKDPELAARP